MKLNTQMLHHRQPPNPQRMSHFIVWFPTVNMISPAAATLLSDNIMETGLPHISPLNKFGFGGAEPITMIFTLDEEGEVLKALFKLLAEDTAIQIDLISGDSNAVYLPTTKFWMSGQAIQIDFDSLDSADPSHLQAYVTFSYDQLQVNGFPMTC